jgi:hypothetical protein
MCGDAAWDRDLTAAFSVLLGAPLESFDPTGEYALYYRNTLDERELFELLDDVDPLRRVVSPAAGGDRPAVLLLCLGLGWGLDLAWSQFELDAQAGTAVGDALDTLPGTAFFSRRRATLTGDELAGLLSAHSLGTADVAAASKDGTLDVDVTLRVVTDGTLRDAMVTAIRGAHGPDGLRPSGEEAQLLPTAAGVFMFTDDVEPPPPAVAAERDRLLGDGIQDPRLRAHVWSPYLDMPWERGEDGTVQSTPATRYQSMAQRPDMDVVAAWDLSYFGEVSLAVVRTGDRTGTPV